MDDGRSFELMGRARLGATLAGIVMLASLGYLERISDRALRPVCAA